VFSLLAVKTKTPSFCALCGAEPPVMLRYTKWLCASAKGAHFSGQGNPAVVCGTAFHSTAGSFSSEGPPVVEVVGAVSLAAEHHQSGGGFPTV